MMQPVIYNTLKFAATESRLKGTLGWRGIRPVFVRPAKLTGAPTVRPRIRYPTTATRKKQLP